MYVYLQRVLFRPSRICLYFRSFNHDHFSYKDIPLYMVDLDRLSEKPSIYIYSLKR